MFLNFLIIFFSILMVVCLFDVTCAIVAFINYGSVEITSEQKAIVRKETFSVIVGGVLGYCLVCIGFLI